MRIDFSLNNTFKEYLTRMHYCGILAAYPEVEKELSDFKNIIEYSSTVIDKNLYDYFGIPINMFFGDDYYYLNWNTTKIENFVRDNHSLAVEVPLSAQNIFSCPSLLEPLKLEHFTRNIIDIPVVLAYHFPIRQYIVIDGNHRYNAAKARKEITIKAIVLNPKLHTSFMLNDLSRNLYFAHHNAHLLINILPFKKYCISDNLEPTSYYPLTERIINFNRIKNIPIYLKRRKLQSLS